MVENDMNSFVSFKDKMKSFRNLEELTMNELAKLSGLSQSYISQLENGKIPSDDNIKQISLGLSKGKYSTRMKIDSYNSYLQSLKESNYADDVILKEKALNEAIDRYNFERGAGRDDFSLFLAEEINRKNKEFINTGILDKLSSFFGMSEPYPETEMKERTFDLLANLSKSRQLEVEKYIEYLWYTQQKEQNKRKI
ncbi:helix-turn-helix transcriptional regulator [Enterococcus cecorum]|uniref:helix-turn-helix domain-containing protein n=1 Tax=Enterococcus cecorum TaxID=44008 RepID=UPI002AC9F3C7|nr:helix-turn-helix transcriptional regulator [Enterococcus cecorum]MDZ5589902.1 helix-turn-helix transcriptional regulator [Enterococcus cecorum]